MVLHHHLPQPPLPTTPISFHLRRRREQQPAVRPPPQPAATRSASCPNDGERRSDQAPSSLRSASSCQPLPLTPVESISRPTPKSRLHHRTAASSSVRSPSHQHGIPMQFRRPISPFSATDLQWPASISMAERAQFQLQSGSKRSSQHRLDDSHELAVHPCDAHQQHAHHRWRRTFHSLPQQHGPPHQRPRFINTPDPDLAEHPHLQFHRKQPTSIQHLAHEPACISSHNPLHRFTAHPSVDKNLIITIPIYKWREWRRAKGERRRRGTSKDEPGESCGRSSRGSFIFVDFYFYLSCSLNFCFIVIFILNAL